MLCERKKCGHELGLHDPCSVKGCRCTSFMPADRKELVATITDPAKRPVKS
jgi:hypothetical protein